MYGDGGGMGTAELSAVSSLTPEYFVSRHDTVVINVCFYFSSQFVFKRNVERSA